MRKISILYIFSFAALILVFVTLAQVFNAGKSEVTAFVETENTTVIIDAGHGGEDGGAVNEQGILEKDINLSIAKKLEKILSLFGVATDMTRTEDSGLGRHDFETIRKRKMSDLKMRAEMVQNTSNAVLISIHQNSFPQDVSCCGAQVFYTSKNVQSRSLAELVQKSLREAIDNNNNRNEKEAEKNIFLLNNVNCPAVLVECGFLTNETESKMLLNENYKTKIAASIAGGYLKFKSEK